MHTAASVAPSLGNAVAPLGSLYHANMPSLLTMFFSPDLAFTGHPFPGIVPLAHGGIPGVLPAFLGGIPPAPPFPPVAPPIPAVPPVPAVVPVVVPVVVPAVVPAVVPVVVPVVVPTVLAVVPAAPVLIALVMPAPPIAPFVPPPAISSGVRTKLLKLNRMKDTKAFLDLLEQIYFCVRMAELSTDHADNSLFTDGANQEAS